MQTQTDFTARLSAGKRPGWHRLVWGRQTLNGVRWYYLKPRAREEFWVWLTEARYAEFTSKSTEPIKVHIWNGVSEQWDWMIQPEIWYRVSKGRWWERNTAV